MKHIKSRADVRAALAAGANAKHMVAALQLLQNYENGYREYGGWIPDEHGWVVLLETAADLADRDGLMLVDGLMATPREGVEAFPGLGCFGVIVILGNDFGLCYVVPEAILTPAQRADLSADILPHPAAPAEPPAGAAPF